MRAKQTGHPTMPTTASTERIRVDPKPGVPLVRALDRGIAILRAFSPEHPRRTLTELARTAELDKGTARRLLHTLAVGGLVERDERTGLFSLAVGVLELASAVATGRDLRDVAIPHLGEIANQTRCTAFLWIHHEGAALCVERARSAHPSVDAAWFTVGSRTPLNCGGGPRVILAFLSPEERRAALAQDLVRRTPASEIDPGRLTQDADRIRARGWELAVDDFVVGLAGLGVPILDRAGALAGSLSISGLTAQVVEDGQPRDLDLLRRAAAEIGAKLF
jgi:DNA-binding IclR family transcriptional regulator